jgi:hypothetical protein
MDVPMEDRVCGQCGMAFSAPVAFMDECRKVGPSKSFYCPAGHGRVFRESRADILQREKDLLERDMQAKLNEANHARLVAEKQAKKAVLDKRKVERRIAHGVCPCCNKTFSDIANHMITEHKDFRLPAGKRTLEIEGKVQ